jgi:hypothetical protein
MIAGAVRSSKETEILVVLFLDLADEGAVWRQF